MPTLDWIQDSDRDRFNEAFPMPTSFTERCPFCSHQFVGKTPGEATRAVMMHVSRDHPIASPVLAIEDRIVGSRVLVARRLVADSVDVRNCQRVQTSIDGAPWQTSGSDAVRTLLAGIQRGVVRLRMTNTRAEDQSAARAEAVIEIDVPSADELDAVDLAFRAHLTSEDVGLDDVRLFSDSTEGLARHYRDGLASYILAVINKDDRSVSRETLQLEKALGRMSRAAYYLAGFSERPVAAAVVACARFNLNDFYERHGFSGLADVDAATLFLQDLAAGAVPPFPTRLAHPRTDLRFRIDSASNECLESLFIIGAHEPQSLDTKVRVIREGSLTTADRAKLAAVIGEAAHRQGASELVNACALTLHNDPIFSRLAARWVTT